MKAAEAAANKINAANMKAWKEKKAKADAAY